MYLTLNDLHASEHYYLRVRQGTDNTNYKYVHYNFHNEKYNSVFDVNDGELMDATVFSSLEEAKLVRSQVYFLIDIPNIYIDIIKHTVKVSVVTDEVVED